MDQLLFLYLLTLLIAAFAGMSIVLRILRSLPFMGFPPMGMTPVAGAQTDQRGGGTNLNWNLILLIVVGGLFWFLFTRSQGSQEPTPEPPAPEWPGEQGMDEHQVVKTYEASAAMQAPAVRVNQKPAASAGPHTPYAVQLAALSSRAGAEEMIAAQRKHRLTIIGVEDGLYKVGVAGFATRTAAERYRKKYRLDGFVRELSQTPEW